MALQTSGPISFSDIRDEFETANPIKMTQFYGKDAKLPRSGKISASDFYGTSNIKKGVLLYSKLFTNSSRIQQDIAIPSTTSDQIWLIVAASSGKDGSYLPTPTPTYVGTGMRPDTSLTRYVSDFDNTGGEDNRVTIHAIKLASDGRDISGTVSVTGIESNNRGGTNETAIWVVGGISDGTVYSKQGSVGTLTNSNQCIVVGAAGAGKWNSLTTEISGAILSNWDKDYSGVGLCLSSGLSNVTVSGGQSKGALWIKI